MIAASVTVSSTPVRLIGPGSGIGGAGGQRVLIRNSHATDALVIGGSGVAANNGYAIAAGQSLDLGNRDPGADAVWAVRGATNDIVAQVLVLP
jgi:hypothetical protein